MKFIPFPELTTDRLLLRQTNINDCKEILFLRSDNEVNKYIKRIKPKSIEEAEAFLNKITKGIENNESINWCITRKENPQMIGSICLWNFSADQKTAEVGYDLHPTFHNQGLMTEALKCVLNFGFDQLKLDEIEAFTSYQNESSKRLLLKNNFTLIENKKDENNSANIIFGITKKIWKTQLLRKN